MKTKIKSAKPSKPKPIKTILSENNIITKAISVIFLVVIMFGLFAFIIIGLYRFELIKLELPAFIENLFFKTAGGDPETVKDDRNIYSFLNENANENENENSESAAENNKGYVLEETPENIKDIISKTTLPDNMYLEIEANYYDNGNITRTEKMSLWKKGGKYKYILEVNSIPEESYINDSKTELIENFVTGDKSKNPANPNFSFNDIPHMPNINYYLSLLESGTIENQHISQNRESNIANIKYSIPGLNQYELIDISLDTGIVERIRCYTLEQNDLYYECKTNVKEAYYDGGEQWENKTPISDSIFEIE